MRIPVNKGHVFLSKERTPVLLLAETLAVGNDGNAEGGEGEEEESNGGRKRCNLGVISSPSAQGNEMSALGSLIRRSSRDYGYKSLSVPAPINVCKRAWFVSRGFQQCMTGERMNDAWTTWAFQSNFMFDPLL